ncbi:acyl-CoA dehydrogenase family protein [Brevibacillus nitrificans]|uniref:acyl-CoA dehydrogenase family protein n=1 Tax=Brevibacillus nitrificans TaxID=651560 RepID=UPI002865F0B3|nr:acyl-CoA dehydrogenase family protein [Brevibacillus nitrificans]MDR7319130.1 acyl-CoA dehydrogenase [Brevibacillus nitrificans]
MSHWIFNEEHEMLRKSVRSFVKKEIAPFVEQWEAAEEFPRELFARMGELGYLGIKFPEEYGGGGADVIADAVMLEEMAKCGSIGVAAGIFAQTAIALTPIWKFGTAQQKRKYLAPGIRGEKIAALGITEADVSSLRTTARRDGDHYVLNGSKMFITNGVRADYVVIAAKTDPAAGHRGISLFIVEASSPGYSVGKKLKKLGWRSSDTAELILDNVHVPKENLLGEENRGFYAIMQNFQWERITLALLSVSLADLALEHAIQYARERTQFGQSILQFQVTKHKLVDMAVSIESARSLTYHALYLYANGGDALTETTMAKASAGEMVSEVTDAALQIHGGNGYMMEYPVQRYWRDARLSSIGGGTTEIMNEILVKRIGLV